MNAAPEVEGDDVVDAPDPAVPKRGLLVRFRDYVWDWRAVMAVGIAMFIVGGLAGLAIGLSMDHGGHRGHRGFRHDPGGHFQRDGFPGGQFPGGQVPGQGFGPGNGQVPNGG